MTTEISFNVAFNSSLEEPSPTELIVLFTSARVWSLRLLSPLSPIIILFGLVANVINMVVFLKAGVKDNVTTLLFSLALSDLSFLVLASPHACFWILWALVRNHPWPFHYRFVHVLFYWPAFTAFDLSAFISVSLGVIRCACVAMPLKFKAVFTRSRTIKWVGFLVILAVSLRLPVLTINRIAWRLEPATNTTRVYVATVNSAYMSRINDIMNRGCVIWLNYIVMVTCVCILSFKLYQASKIRRSCTTSHSSNVSDQEKTDNSTGNSMSSRDLQVVKSVVLVCSIFILSQLPFLLVSLTRLLNTQFNTSGRLHGLFGTISNIGRTCSFLNASVNIFVYYNFNSKFRSNFLSLLQTQPKVVGGRTCT